MTGTLYFSSFTKCYTSNMRILTQANQGYGRADISHTSDWPSAFSYQSFYESKYPSRITHEKFINSSSRFYTSKILVDDIDPF